MRKYHILPSLFICSPSVRVMSSPAPHAHPAHMFSFCQGHAISCTPCSPCSYALILSGSCHLLHLMLSEYMLLVMETQIQQNQEQKRHSSLNKYICNDASFTQDSRKREAKAGKKREREDVYDEDEADSDSNGKIKILILSLI